MRVSKKLFKKLSALSSAMLDENGKEQNNPIPKMISPGGPEPLQDRIQRLVRTELSREAAMQEHETFEESQDFEIEDTFDLDDPVTPYMVMEDEFPVMTDETPPDQPVEDAPIETPEEPKTEAPEEEISTQT